LVKFACRPKVGLNPESRASPFSAWGISTKFVVIVIFTIVIDVLGVAGYSNLFGGIIYNPKAVAIKCFKSNPKSFKAK
jgi:hypothetical protein